MIENSPKPVAKYSQGVQFGNMLFISGQGPIDAKTGCKPEGIQAQTEKVLLNIKSILEGAGYSLNDVVKVNAYLSDLANFSKFNSVYEKYFEEIYPVRTTIGCELLNILVEIDVIACKISKARSII
jgi:2-iminobutanoate/2-iminopropanoate deaminase